jgi:hypothetical protein
VGGVVGESLILAQGAANHYQQRAHADPQAGEVSLALSLATRRDSAGFRFLDQGSVPEIDVDELLVWHLLPHGPVLQLLEM